MSMPMQNLFNISLAINVVPDPKKGSNTMECELDSHSSILFKSAKFL